MSEKKVMVAWLENKDVVSLVNGKALTFAVENQNISVHIRVRSRRPLITVVQNVLGLSVKVAEVGVNCGDNALEICNALHPSELYLIDVWNGSFKDSGSTMFSLSVAADLLKDKVTPHNIRFWQGTSEEQSKRIADEYLDFVYIDADHSYEEVKKDIDLWLPKIRKGGIIGGHDMHLEDVQKAVAEKFPQYDHFLNEWYAIKE